MYWYLPTLITSEANIKYDSIHFSLQFNSIYPHSLLNCITVMKYNSWDSRFGQKNSTLILLLVGLEVRRNLVTFSLSPIKLSIFTGIIASKIESHLFWNRSTKQRYSSPRIYPMHLPHKPESQEVQKKKLER